MLESEAKKKWCPHARVLAEMYRIGDSRKETIGANASFNRMTSKKSGGPNPPLASACLGSACMMWEPHGEVATVAKLAEHGFDIDPRWAARGWVNDPDQSGVELGQIRMTHEPWGDCGLKAKG